MRLLSVCALFLLMISAVVGQAKKPQSTAQVGMKAQAFTATAIDGKIYTLADLKGKIVVLNFWSTKCIICAAETEDLNKIAEAYKTNADVVFLGIAHQSKPQVEQFLRKKPFKYKIVPAGLQNFIVTYGIPQDNGFFDIEFPTHILINREGVIEINQTGIKGVKAVEEKLAKIFKEEAKAKTKKD